jgi:hypothetical protein
MLADTDAGTQAELSKYLQRRYLNACSPNATPVATWAAGLRRAMQDRGHQ